MGIGYDIGAFQSEWKIAVESEELKIRQRGNTKSCVVEHVRRDTVRTRSSVNRNTRNETANFIWVAEKIWRVVM